MHTSECDRVAALLEASQGDLAASELASALDHIDTCAHCRHRLGFLSRALASEREDTLACEECQARLPEYLQAQADRQASAPGWADIALHLRACPHCAAQQRELAGLLAFAHGEAGAEPPAYPEHTPITARAGLPGVLIDRLGRLVIAFSEQLLGAFQPARSLAEGPVRSEPEPDQRRQLVVDQSSDDRLVTISAEPKRGTSDRWVITVRVEIPSRGGWPNLAGSQVLAQVHGVTLAAQLTDPLGNAVFDDIPGDALTSLALVITPRSA